MVRGTSVLVPPLGGEKVVRSTKRGMLGGNWKCWIIEKGVAPWRRGRLKAGDRRDNV